MVDAQSVKNTDCAGSKGYDAGKKVSGIKRYIVVASPGLPHAIVVTTANVTDRQGVLAPIEVLKQNKKHLSEVVSILVDGDYPGQPFAEDVRNLLRTSVQVATRNE